MIEKKKDDVAKSKKELNMQQDLKKEAALNDRQKIVQYKSNIATKSKEFNKAKQEQITKSKDVNNREKYVSTTKDRLMNIINLDEKKNKVINSKMPSSINKVNTNIKKGGGMNQRTNNFVK